MPPIKFMIEDFLESKEDEENVKESTLTTYKFHLNEFHKYCTEQENIVNVEDVTYVIIKNYFRYVTKERNNGASSYNTKLKNINAFFNYLIKEEILEESPVKKMKRKKEDTKIEIFTDKHIKLMLRHYRRMRKEKEFFGYRDYTIIYMLLGTGLRIGELCELKWKDLDLDNKEMKYHASKTRKDNTLPMVAEVVSVLKEWKLYCGEEFDKLSPYVFVTKSNEKLSVNGAKNIFKRLKKKMNFDDVRVSAHTFRHTFTQKYIQNGGDVFSLREMLNHANVKTTDKYHTMWGTALKEQNDKFNPLKNMDI